MTGSSSATRAGQVTQASRSSRASRNISVSADMSLSEIPRAEFSMPRTRLRPMFAQSGPFGL
ncbi:hypothetical protein [Paracoccus sphaerophysae]